MWPLITTVANNGYAGLEVIPRWPTNIYYNCDSPACTTLEWITFSKGSGVFDDLLAYEKLVTTRYLLGLKHDAYMFHQANLRVSDVPTITINGVTAKLSIFQAWVETIVQEMIRLTNWPIVTIKHDDMGAQFTARMARDHCNPNMIYNVDLANRKITGVTVGTDNGNTCGTPVPVSLPGPVVNQFGATAEQIGHDPLTLWTTLVGQTVTYTLVTPISY